MRSWLKLLVFTFVVFTTPFLAAKETRDADTLHLLFEEFYKTIMQQSPEFATFFGYEGLDHLWTDLSHASEQRNHQQIKKIDKLFHSIHPQNLSESDLLNYKVLKWILRDFDKKINPFPHSHLCLDHMHGFHLMFEEVLAIMPKETSANYNNLYARLEGIPAAIEQRIRLLKEGIKIGVVAPRITVELVTEQILAQIPKNPRECRLYRFFKHAPLPIKKKAFKTVVKQIYPAFKKLHGFVSNMYLPSTRETIGFKDLPNGKKWYQHLIEYHTTTHLKPKAIHTLGKTEVARIKVEMQKIVDQLGFNGSLNEFFHFMRTDPRFFFDKEEELLAHYKDLMAQIEKRLPELFGVITKIPCHVVPVPAHRGKGSPTACYLPGSIAAKRPGFFYANTFDLKARPKWEMESLTLHEALPGHHQQIMVSLEQTDLPKFRNMILFTGYVEGWGLYSESLGHELGLYRDPFSDFGRLSCEIFRACRLVVDTGIHAGGWTRDQAIQYFLNNTALCLVDIEAEVDRYIINPGQALAYKIGQLKISEMRVHAETVLKERFDIRAFHDKVLDSGALPLNLFEERMRTWVERQAA